MVFSNLAILPAVLHCVAQKSYLDAFIFFQTGCWSAIYHVCDMHYYCPESIGGFKTLQQMDVSSSFVTMVVVVLKITKFSPHVHNLLLIGMSILVVVQVTRGEATDPMNWVLCMGGAFTLLIGRIVQRTIAYPGPGRVSCGKLRQVCFEQVDASEFNIGLLMVALGAFGFVYPTIVDPDAYWWCHSIWHTSIMGSVLVFFRAVETAEKANAATDESVQSIELPEIEQGYIQTILQNISPEPLVTADHLAAPATSWWTTLLGGDESATPPPSPGRRMVVRSPPSTERRLGRHRTL